MSSKCCGVEIDDRGLCTECMEHSDDEEYTGEEYREEGKGFKEQNTATKVIDSQIDMFKQMMKTFKL